MQFYLYALSIINCLKLILSWDLSSLGIIDNCRLEHVSIYFIRAFLCIRTPINATYLPTLIESTWPENLIAVRPKVFPNGNAHATNPDEVCDCKKIHKARLTDIDDYGRLWVFDAGNGICSEKIVAYSLLQKNKEVFRTDCLGSNGDKVTTMKIDPNSSNTGYLTIFFTLNHGKYISVFNLEKRKWQKIKVNTGPEWDFRNIHIHELAFTLDHRIYFADEHGNLYITVAKRNKIRDNITDLQVTLLGSLLGRSKSLITDPLGILYYILPKDGAIARWEPSRTLNAEGHDILHFEAIPIVQILFGVQGSVWIATERVHYLRDHCYRILYHFSIGSETIIN